MDCASASSVDHTRMRGLQLAHKRARATCMREVTARPPPRCTRAVPAPWMSHVPNQQRARTQASKHAPGGRLWSAMMTVVAAVCADTARRSSGTRGLPERNTKRVPCRSAGGSERLAVTDEGNGGVA